MSKGLKKLYDVSEELCELIDAINDKSTLDADEKKNIKKYDMARTTATKVVWLYIKENDLQNPDNGREIFNDGLLDSMAGKKKMTMFEVGKMLNSHLFDKNS